MCKCSSCSFCAASDDADGGPLPPSPPSTPPGAAELALSAQYAVAYESAFKAAMLEVQRAEAERLARAQAEAEQACQGAYSLVRCWRAHGLDIRPPPPPPLPPSPPPELPARETASPRAVAAANKAARAAERARQREEMEQAERLAREEAVAVAELTALGITLLPPPAAPPARSAVAAVAGGGGLAMLPALHAGVQGESGAGDDASGGAVRGAAAVGAVALLLVAAEAWRCQARRRGKGGSGGVPSDRRGSRRTHRIPQEEDLELEAAVPAPRRQQRLPGRARR